MGRVLNFFRDLRPLIITLDEGGGRRGLLISASPNFVPVLQSDWLQLHQCGRALALQETTAVQTSRRRQTSAPLKYLHSLDNFCPLHRSPCRQHAPTIDFTSPTLTFTCTPLPNPPLHSLRQRHRLPALLQNPCCTQHVSSRLLPLSAPGRQPLQYSRAIFPHACCRAVCQPRRHLPCCPGRFGNNPIPRRLGSYACGYSRTVSSAAALRSRAPLHCTRRIAWEIYPSHSVCQWPRNHDYGERQARRATRCYGRGSHALHQRL